MAALTVTSGPASGVRIDVDDSVTIGREDTDLVLDDAEVSRRHAQIRAVEGGLVIEDLGSRNGVRVDGLRITAPTRVHDGAILKLGQTTLVVELPLPEVHPTRPGGQATRESTPGDVTILGSADPGRADGPDVTEVRRVPPARRQPPAPRRSPVPSAAGGATPEFGAFRTAQPSGRRGVATRLWVPAALTYAAIAGTAGGLIAYFA